MNNLTVARFWREQKNRYNFLGTKCGNCGRIYFPPVEICRDCHRKSFGKMVGIELSGQGKIVSYTIIHDGPETFKAQIPYVMAIIELDDGPQVTGQIVDVSLQKDEAIHRNELPENNFRKEKSEKNKIKQELAIGSRVSSVFRKISQDGKSGIIHYGYKFKLTPKTD